MGVVDLDGLAKVAPACLYEPDSRVSQGGNGPAREVRRRDDVRADAPLGSFPTVRFTADQCQLDGKGLRRHGRDYARQPKAENPPCLCGDWNG